jgi:holo-[acyl-carrier protein] synthase
VSLRVGTDLVAVETVSQALRDHGDRYLERVYTEREVADCRRGGEVDAERLAARFAAKEATLKVLRPDEEGVPLSSIEVRRDRTGWVALELSGPAAALAERAGIVELSLSVAHEQGLANAVVVAECA